LRGIHFGEDLIEAVVIRGERLTEHVEELVDVVEGGFGEAARPTGAIDALLDEAGGLKHLEVAGYGRLTHLEGLGEFEDGSFSEGQAGEDSAPGRVGESGEAGVKHFHNVKVI